MSGLADEAQRLQDHMEQHYGVCLQASQWDAAIAALRQPATDAAAKRDWFISINKTLAAQREEDPDAGDMQGLVERIAAAMRDAGDWQWEMVLSGDGGYEFNTRTQEGWLADGRSRLQSITARNATLLAKCLEAEEGWENALLAPLAWNAELTAERDNATNYAAGVAKQGLAREADVLVLITHLAAERAKVAELVEGFGDFIGSPQSCKTWGLPDTEAVIIDTTLGKIKQARALIERMK